VSFSVPGRYYAETMDLTLFNAINGAAAHHDGLIEDPLRFFAIEAPVLFIVLLAALFLATGRLRSVSARHGVVAAGFSAALALGAAQVLNHLWARPRPYVAHPGDAHLFIAPTHDTSFPSDHATAAFAIAVAIALRSRRAGWVALALATLVAVSRVAVGTHYPSDVLAGAAIGTLAALVVFHPRVRGPLHRLADLVGGTYDALLLRVRPD
jgi:undecaprenyl-diphosphatase